MPDRPISTAVSARSSVVLAGVVLAVLALASCASPGERTVDLTEPSAAQAVASPGGYAMDPTPPAPVPGPFSLPALPYAHDALEPVIDTRTMRLHHLGHHQIFVNNLNTAVAQDAALQGLTVERILADASSRPAAVRNNAGGLWNHAFFWTVMAPPGQGGAPSAPLLAAITRDFGSMEGLRTAFRQASMGRFGSGWAWVVVRPDGRLEVGSTPNQDNPLMDTQAFRGTPILGNDLWEHAFYLLYQYRRAEYVDAWWGIVNWAEVSRRHAEATAALTPAQ
jgi:Fe-Mn family superoxide dismutase